MKNLKTDWILVVLKVKTTGDLQNIKIQNIIQTLGKVQLKIHSTFHNKSQVK